MILKKRSECIEDGTELSLCVGCSPGAAGLFVRRCELYDVAHINSHCTLPLLFICLAARDMGSLDCRIDL